MITLERPKLNASYEGTKMRAQIFMREFELAYKEKTMGLTNLEQEELGAMRIASALKEDFYC